MSPPRRNQSTPRRQRILVEQGLAVAPREVQRQFWARYNRQGWSHRFARLGELAAAWWSSQFADGRAVLIEQACQAWEAVVPRECRGCSRVEGLRAGRLHVAVDDAATRYRLSCQVGEAALLRALAGQLGRQVISAIEIRLCPRGDRDRLGRGGGRNSGAS